MNGVQGQKYQSEDKYMITIFNRKELISTFDMRKQGNIRQLLAQNKIDYNVKIINRESPSLFLTRGRTATGTYGKKSETEYVIYVRRIDFEKAAAVVRGCE
ncbi:hypothetical protein [Faecalicatena contorta]|nr:hypothetical protein [Faecalicatena contorta]